MVIDVDEYPVYNPILRQKQLKTMVGVPLLVRGASLGVLHVGTLSAAAVHAGRGRAAPDRRRAGRDRHRAGAAARGADPARPAQAELRRHRLARAAHAGDVRLRRPQDACGPRPAAERGAARGAAPRRGRAGRASPAAARGAARPLASRRPRDQRRAAAGGAEGRHSPTSSRARWRGRKRSSSTSPRISPPSSIRSCSSASSRTSSRTRSATARRRSGSSAQQRDRHLRVAVEDSGPGVPKELEGRIFDRFARGGGETGHGLGLAIARAYAQAHGGDLVYDPRPGGARFELLIPQERNGLSAPA